MQAGPSFFDQTTKIPGIQFKMAVSESLGQLRATEKALKELDEAEEILKDGKYETIPHGWHLYSALKADQLKLLMNSTQYARMTSLVKEANSLAEKTGYDHPVRKVTK